MCSIEEALLKISQYSQENTSVGVSFNNVVGCQACNFIEKRSPTKLFSCKCCEIFKNTHFEEHLQTTAFEKA